MWKERDGGTMGWFHPTDQGAVCFWASTPQLLQRPAAALSQPQPPAPSPAPHSPGVCPASAMASPCQAAGLNKLQTEQRERRKATPKRLSRALDMLWASQSLLPSPSACTRIKLGIEISAEHIISLNKTGCNMLFCHCWTQFYIKPRTNLNSVRQCSSFYAAALMDPGKVEDVRVMPTCLLQSGSTVS